MLTTVSLVALIGRNATLTQLDYHSGISYPTTALLFSLQVCLQLQIDYQTCESNNMTFNESKSVALCVYFHSGPKALPILGMRQCSDMKVLGITVTII